MPPTLPGRPYGTFERDSAGPDGAYYEVRRDPATGMTTMMLLRYEFALLRCACDRSSTLILWHAVLRLQVCKRIEMLTVGCVQFSYAHGWCT
jgi:hypothetical protein